MVLSWLVRDSDVVLMDLRGFSSQHTGCVFEINELINVIALDRVIFVVEDTTDRLFLREVAQRAWSQMQATSPNRLATAAQMRLFRFTGRRSKEVRQIIHALCVAIRTTPAAYDKAAGMQHPHGTYERGVTP